MESQVVAMRGLSKRGFRWLIVGAGALTFAAVAVSLCVLTPSTSDPEISSPPAVEPSVTESKPRWEHPETPIEDFVGSDACVECHQEICDAYRSHPMAQSLAEVGDAAPIEDFEFEKPIAPWRAVHYRVAMADNHVFHHEIMSEKDGQVLYDQSVEVNYAVGSGSRARSYLIDRDGLLFLSPISWYPQKKRWDLSPGYRPGNHYRVEQRVGDGCVGCHAGRMRFDRAQRDRYLQPPFAETAIGCERCHGPGGRHVKAHRSSSGTPQSDPIVSLAKLDSPWRDNVCSQCHLHGEKRILRYGRSHHDFRPGGLFDDVWIVLVAGSRRDETERVRNADHVQQMQASACFQRSDGRMGCVSCHDPHTVPAEEKRADFYRVRCLKCHDTQTCSLSDEQQSQPPARGSCVCCHMPKRPTNDVLHTAVTDHRIVRRRDTKQGEVTTGSLRPINGTEQRVDPLVLDRARGLVLAKNAEEQQDDVIAIRAERLLLPVLEVAPDDIDVLEALGVACHQQHRYTQATKYWLKVLEYRPQHEDALRRLAVLLHDTGDIRYAQVFIERSLAVNPWIADLHGRYAHVLGRQGRLDDGIRAAKRSLELDPADQRLYGWLAEVYHLRGDDEQATHFKKLLETFGNR